MSKGLETKSQICHPEHSTIFGEPFLILQNESIMTKIRDLCEVPNERILALGTPSMFEVMKTATRLSIDSTFKVVESVKYQDTQFAQCLTISTQAGGDSDSSRCPVLFNVIVLYLLLPNKTISTYDRASRICHLLAPGMAPKVVNVDFEYSELRSFTANFPSAILTPCLWHFYKCLRRNAQVHGLQSELTYSKGCYYKLWKLLKALPFVDLCSKEMSDCVLDILNSLVYGFRHTAKGRILEKYIKGYVLRTWFSPRARFPPRIWNKPIRQEVLQESFRHTSSLSEQLHSRISSVMNKSNACLRSTCEVLHTVMKETTIAYRNFEETGEFRQRKSREVQVRRVLTLKYTQLRLKHWI